MVCRRHGVQRAGTPHCFILVADLYFPSLASSARLEGALHVRVVAPATQTYKHVKLSVEKMFKEFPPNFTEKQVKERIVKQKILHRAVKILGVIVSTVMLAAMLAALPSVPSAQGQDAATGAAIPPGTILPVRLNSSLSSAESKPGQIISARIMQDVPLATGGKIREW